METTIPSILPGAWTSGIELGRDNAVKLFRSFVQKNNGDAPDERGLTDKFLLDLQTRNVTMNIEKHSQFQESTSGYDYAWRFQFQGPDGNWRQKIVLLQAKSYKLQSDGSWLADFTYHNKNGYQVDLLHARIEEVKNNNPNAWVIGGYLMYSDVGLQYLSTKDLTTAVAVAKKQGITTDGRINKYLSDFFYDDRTGQNDVQLIYQAKW